MKKIFNVEDLLNEAIKKAEKGCAEEIKTMNNEKLEDMFDDFHEFISGYVKISDLMMISVLEADRRHLDENFFKDIQNFLTEVFVDMHVLGIIKEVEDDTKED